MSAFEIIGLALAVPGIIDLCLTYGKTLVDKVETYKQADQILHEKQFRVEDHWVKIRTELIFVRSISSKLAQDVNDHFLRLLQQLLGKLESAIRLLDSLYTKSEWKRKMKLAMSSGFGGVQKVIADLDEWQGCFSNYLMLITLVGDKSIDAQLTQDHSGSQSLERIQRIRTALNSPMPKKLALSQESVDHNVNYMQRSLLPDSGMELIITPSFVVEYKPFEPPASLSPSGISQYLQDFRSDICNLSQVLSASDPQSMNIPQCHGFLHNAGKARFEIFYNLPVCGQSSSPRTLRNLLTSKENKLGAIHSINDRFRLASQLAQAVLYVHSAKMVHKNIRPETIIVMEPPAHADKKTKFPYTLGHPVLFGFTKIREIVANSERVGDQDWEKNIYRHPQRQGLHPEERYSILHDVYSLGVCLLEICLWTPFVIWDSVRGEYKNNSEACSLFEKHIDPQTGQRKLKSPTEIQKIFVRKAQQAIPRIMGERFASVVVSCLTCLEGGLGDIEDLADENGVVMGIAYVDRVLQMLDGISV